MSIGSIINQLLRPVIIKIVSPVLSADSGISQTVIVRNYKKDDSSVIVLLYKITLKYLVIGLYML